MNQYQGKRCFAGLMGTYGKRQSWSTVAGDYSVYGSNNLDVRRERASQGQALEPYVSDPRSVRMFM